MSLILKRLNIVSISVFVLSTLLFSCQSEHLTKLALENDKQNPTDSVLVAVKSSNEIVIVNSAGEEKTVDISQIGFNEISQFYIQPLCSQCHTSETKAGVNLSTYVSTLKTLVPGESGRSRLLQSVLNGSMPKDNRPVSEEVLKLVELWIDGGAQEHAADSSQQDSQPEPQDNNNDNPQDQPRQQAVDPPNHFDLFGDIKRPSVIPNGAEKGSETQFSNLGQLMHAKCFTCHNGIKAKKSINTYQDLVRFVVPFNNQQSPLFLQVENRHGDYSGNHDEMKDDDRKMALALIKSWLNSGAADASGEPMSRTLIPFNFSQGEKIYQSQCAGCHGVNAEGNEKLKAPLLRILSQNYLIQQLKFYKHGQRQGGNSSSEQAMVKSAKKLGHHDRINVAGYIGSMKPEFNPLKEKLDADLVTKGQAIFTQYCKDCHGSKAEGRQEVLMPRLLGQDLWYLKQEAQKFIDDQRGTLDDRSSFLMQVQLQSAVSSEKDLDALMQYIGSLSQQAQDLREK